MNWYGRLVLNDLPVKSWTLTQCINALIAISTYEGYKNSTVKQKTSLFERILSEKRIKTVKNRPYTFRTKIKEWMDKRIIERPAVLLKKSSPYVSPDSRRKILRQLWTTGPHRNRDWHNHYGALLFLAISSAGGQRLGDFARCRWEDFRIVRLPESNKKVSCFELNN